MTPVDGLIVAVIGLSAVVSLWRGFVKEAISLLSWIAAFAVAIAMTPQLSQLLAETISTAALRMLLAFLLRKTQKKVKNKKKCVPREKCSPLINEYLKNDFDGKTKLIFKSATFPPGPRPGWPLHTFCVLLCIPLFETP